MRDISKFYDIPEPRGELTISIRSPEFQPHWRILREPPRPGAENQWRKLPGDYLPMVLLSQSQRGATWGEITLAGNALVPQCRLERNTLYKYQATGFTRQSGTRWVIVKSRAALTERAGERVELDYCGDSGILWGLYCSFTPEEVGHLPTVEIAAATPEHPAYLHMIWPSRLRGKIESFLIENSVEIGECLWTL